MSIEELENKLLDTDDIFLELEDEYEDIKISKKIIYKHYQWEGNDVPFSMFRKSIVLDDNKIKDLLELIRINHGARVSDICGFSIEIFFVKYKPRSESHLDDKLKKAINLIKKSEQILENVEISTITTGHHIGPAHSFKSIEEMERHEFPDLRPPISIRVNFEFVKMKHLKSFESFNVISSLMNKKSIESEFIDVEDYFTDFFDLSNDEWKISVQEYIGTTLKIKIIKKEHSSTHMWGDKWIGLIKGKNEMDNTISKCMDRLAKSKGLIVKYKKKIKQDGVLIGYHCSLFGYHKIEEKVGEKEISSIETYISGMSKSMNDKLFFLDKIESDLIVDFGCADGSILSEIQRRRPDLKLIGYDIDEDMISRARSKNGKILFTSSWERVLEEVNRSKSPTLNLSSVIHEVYSYSNSKTIKNFWEKQVFGSGFKWITIRDMIPSTEISRKEIDEFRDDVKKVREIADPKYLNSFEEKWGTIDDNYRTLTHFLLKYKFTDNWDREVLENYLPVGLETLKKKIPNEYKISYEDSFILPYLKRTIKEDFDIEINHSTHTKMVLKSG